MVVVHQLALAHVVASVTVSSTEPAGAVLVTCNAQAAELPAFAGSALSMGTSLVQVKTVVKKVTLTQPVSPLFQLMKRKIAKVAKARSSLVHTKASSRGRVVLQANVLSRGRSLVQANATSRGQFIAQRNTSGSAPSLVQTNTSGSGSSMVHINDVRSWEPRLQQRLASLIQQGIGFSNEFPAFSHGLAPSQEALNPTGFWMCATLISLMVISCVAALVFISARPHRPVPAHPAPVCLRGTRQRAVQSGKATPGCMQHGTCGSLPSSGLPGQLASLGSRFDPEPAGLASTRRPPASQLLSVVGEDAVSSVLSVTHPDVAAMHAHSTLTGPNDRSSMDPYFCWGLIVPPACDCVLKVPLTCLSEGPFNACDPNDNAVLRVEPRPLHQTGSGTEGLLKLVLTTELGTTVAQCMPSPARIAGQLPERKQRECVLLRASGDVFAVIKMEGDEHERYTLITNLDSRLHISGSKHEQTLNIMDTSGKLVAKTSRMTDQLDLIPSWAMAGHGPKVSMGSDKVYFKLSISPLMDVALILCVVLCIHHLM